MKTIAWNYIPAQIVVAAVISILAVGCSPSVPQDQAESASKQGVEGGGNAPATPIDSGGALPGQNPVNPVSNECPASSQLSWMIQDVSYTIDFFGSAEKPSHFCQGSVPVTAVGASVTVSSSNGTQGSIQLKCAAVNGAPRWQVSLSTNSTTGAPVGSSCGVYTTSYRPTNLSKVKYIRVASLQANAAETMYGVSMFARSYAATNNDHLFSVDVNEGPNAGYQLEGLGFNVVHRVATQDRGASAAASPVGLVKIHRCNSAARGRHYMTIGACNETAGDIDEGTRYIFKDNSVMALGVAKTPLYRCRSTVLDFVTSSESECTAASGATTLIGYTIQ